jgi:photoactive yellow protein
MVMLDDLDDRTLDELPFGVICLSRAGKVLRMNRTEAERTGIQRWRAIGRDFFRDVAFVYRHAADQTRIEVERGRDPPRLYLRIHR